MEFRDEDGVRRFFRMRDQAPKADNDTLKFMQSKINLDDEEEAAFIRGLQRQININLDREGKLKGEIRRSMRKEEREEEDRSICSG